MKVHIILKITHHTWFADSDTVDGVYTNYPEAKAHLLRRQKFEDRCYLPTSYRLLTKKVKSPDESFRKDET